MGLTFDDYQERAKATDLKPDGEDGLVMALMGLVGEAGALMTEYKKRVRDNRLRPGFEAQVGIELGDLLWYIANIASKCGLSLDAVAELNLAKTRARFLPPAHRRELFDRNCDAAEQLPRTFEYTFEYRVIGGRRKVVMLDGSRVMIGNPLTDNAYSDDGYRFHDVLHLAHAAILGWSPVLRHILKCKRKSAPDVDEVEDGARAQIIEECVAAATYEYAASNRFLEVEHVDWDSLRIIKRLTANLEVRIRSEAEWERAILAAFHVWRQLRDADGGQVRGDIEAQTLTLVPLQP